MKVSSLVEKLGLKIFTKTVTLERNITGGYTGDLLSDVMGSSKDGNILITIQSHKNVMAIASLKELSAVLLVKGIEPEPEMLEKAEEEEIAVLGCNKAAFEISAEVYNLINE